VEVKLFTADYAERYQQFLYSIEQSLLYASYKYICLLEKLLKVTHCTLMAVDNNDNILGVLPAMMMQNKQYGNVLNSLPYYGSHGGIISRDDDESVKKCLLNAFYDYAYKNNCISSTIITSPFDANFDFYQKNALYNFTDYRIGQITTLPINSFDSSESLMAMYHQKTRNMVRKAQKQEIEVSNEISDSMLEFLINTHIDNMQVIGGKAKERQFFELIYHSFEKKYDYQLFIAKKDGVPIAGLLNLYFNKTVEYFTPVIIEEYRSLQPLSLIVYYAMQDAINAGYKWWNWGGTWPSQTGVYDFKKRWGTTDNNYYYFTQCNKSLLTCSPHELMTEFPNFYVVPFSNLVTKNLT
jgi:hypothetical protein